MSLGGVWVGQLEFQSGGSQRLLTGSSWVKTGRRRGRRCYGSSLASYSSPGDRGWLTLGARVRSSHLMLSTSQVPREQPQCRRDYALPIFTDPFILSGESSILACHVIAQSPLQLDMVM